MVYEWNVRSAPNHSEVPFSLKDTSKLFIVVKQSNVISVQKHSPMRTYANVIKKSFTARNGSTVQPAISRLDFLAVLNYICLKNTVNYLTGTSVLKRPGNLFWWLFELFGINILCRKYLIWFAFAPGRVREGDVR